MDDRIASRRAVLKATGSGVTGLTMASAGFSGSAGAASSSTVVDDLHRRDDPFKDTRPWSDEYVYQAPALDIETTASQAVGIDYLGSTNVNGEYLYEVNVMQSCYQDVTNAGSADSLLEGAAMTVEFAEENETDFYFRDDPGWMKGWDSEDDPDEGDGDFITDAGMRTGQWGIDVLTNTLDFTVSTGIDTATALIDIGGMALSRTQDGNDTATHTTSVTFDDLVKESHLYRRFEVRVNNRSSVSFSVRSTWDAVQNFEPVPSGSDLEGEYTIVGPCFGCRRVW